MTDELKALIKALKETKIKYRLEYNNSTALDDEDFEDEELYLPTIPFYYVLVKAKYNYGNRFAGYSLMIETNLKPKTVENYKLEELPKLIDKIKTLLP